ncbi:MAG: SIMPL domain-containing protein [Gemmatimonadaceae bacterium]
MPVRPIALLLALALASLSSTKAAAQFAQRPSESPRQVVVSASATVDVTPDRARLVIAVESRGQTSVAAAAENARIQAAVLDAVRRAGVASEQIRTLAVTVNPEYRYPAEGGRPTVIGYQARNTIQVEVHDLTKVSAVIDGAVGRGATNVNGPHLFVEDEAGARREALRRAVQKARLEAQAIAEAADVSLGPVLEITTASGGGEIPRFDQARMMEASQVASTPIETGLISVTASVTIRIAIVQR